MMLGGGQGIKGILANAGTGVASGLTVGSKALQKLDRGGVTSGATKSLAGRSVRSNQTRRTGGIMSRTGSRAGSRKSKAENDVADMELEEIEAIIEEKDREMKMLNKEIAKIQRSKTMN